MYTAWVPTAALWVRRALNSGARPCLALPVVPKGTVHGRDCTSVFRTGAHCFRCRFFTANNKAVNILLRRSLRAALVLGVSVPTLWHELCPISARTFHAPNTFPLSCADPTITIIVLVKISKIIETMTKNTKIWFQNWWVRSEHSGVATFYVMFGGYALSFLKTSPILCPVHYSKIFVWGRVRT